MKKFNQKFISHLRSYRTFHFLFFTFILLITSVIIYIFNDKIYAQDLLEQAFQPAMTNETIINLWVGKNAVGNEILTQWVGVSVGIGPSCDINWQKISEWDIGNQKAAAWFGWDNPTFCRNILWWTWSAAFIQGSTTTQAPLIVRVAKFLLRMTMVLSITMVIFNGIMWIIESSKWVDVKDAKKNIQLIVIGILISLLSLGIINLISSITVSSLN